MQRIATIVENGRVTGIIDGPDAVNQVIIVNGRKWRFDFDIYGGPLWLKADSHTPRKCQCPNKKVWTEWEKWHKKWMKANKSH